MLKWILLAGVVAMGVGCSEDSTMRQRQDSTLKDPWSYSPFRDDDPSVSGGGMSDFSGKAFKRDVNSVFGP